MSTGVESLTWAGPVAEVVVDVAAAGVDRPLDYWVPPELAGRLRLGHRVLVPLRGRRVEGFVVGLRAGSDRPDLRPVGEVLEEEPVFGEEELALAAWVSERYGALRVDGLRCLLPPHSRLGLKRRVGSARRQAVAYRLAQGVEERLQGLLEAKGRRAPAQARLLQVLAEGGGALWERERLLEAAGVSPSALRALVREGLVAEEKGLSSAAAADNGPLWLHPLEGAGHRGELTPDQRRALALVEERLAEEGPKRPVLLQGVTGSGKTEVYLQAAAKVLAEGGHVLVLVPEIALTPQAVARFRARFGDRVALWHSRLAPGERVEEWWRIRRGEAPIVLGTRSAVFAPLQRLRLIVVDEEHEPSYKQDEAPRYHARDVAWERARRAGALLLLGTATPSAETYWQAAQGTIDVVEMPTRVHGRPLPPVELVDMRQELKEGHRGILSRRLQEAIAEHVSRGRQVVLFLNRRGYSNFLLCLECGGAVHCPACAVSLTYHAPEDALRCHYCGQTRPLPPACPHCGSRLLRRFGAGTQRVEEAVRALFPQWPTARLDLDTTARKGEMERILLAFRRGEVPILIGTQMVAKGHDFPRVGLVGAIAADSGLNLPDFRSAERTFQLLTQVAGRAGRAGVDGEVIIQTYNPDHYSIRAAQGHDLPLFFRHELAFRQAGGYPPFRHLARLIVSGPDLAAVREVAQRARREAAGELTGLVADVIGPAPAPIARIQGRHRWHLVIKGEREDVRLAALALRAAALRIAPTGVRIGLDIDPMSMM